MRRYLLLLLGLLTLLLVAVGGGAWWWRRDHYGAAPTTSITEVPRVVRSLDGGGKVAVSAADAHRVQIQWYDATWRGWTAPVDLWSSEDDWITGVGLRVIGGELVDVKLSTKVTPRATNEEQFGGSRWWCLDRDCSETGRVEVTPDRQMAWILGSAEVFVWSARDGLVPVDLSAAQTDFQVSGDGSMTALRVRAAGDECRAELWWSPGVPNALLRAATSPAFPVVEQGGCAGFRRWVGYRSAGGAPARIVLHGDRGRRVVFTRDGEEWAAELD